VPIKSLRDLSAPTPNEVQHIEEKTYEAFLMPFRGGLKDRLYHSTEGWAFFRRLLTMVELIGECFHPYFIPYNNLLFQADRLLAKGGFKAVLISGSPFNQFSFAYHLQRKHKIEWVADYRDAWTTSKINSHQSNMLWQFINSLQARSEKRWVSTASVVTSVSRDLTKDLANFLSIRGEVVSNGFDEEDLEWDRDNIKTYDQFTITYIGSLYDGQPIEDFCSLMNRFFKEDKSRYFRLLFPGLDFFSAQKDRVFKALDAELHAMVETTARVPREKILEIERRSHILLYVGWNKHKGVIPSKIYEYLMSDTPILVFPGDGADVDAIVDSTDSGCASSDESEALSFVEGLYLDHQQGKFARLSPTRKGLDNYSRRHQAYKLAQIINDL
jgi:hypothetical protein